MRAVETTPAASRNAGEEVALVRRAHVGTDPGHLNKKKTSSADTSLLRPGLLSSQASFLD